MPKGTIRNPGSNATNKKRGVQREINKSAKYATKEYKQKEALSWNKLRDTANYMNDGTGKFGTIGPKKRASMARDVRADKSVMRKAKKTIRPLGSAKKGFK